MTRLPSTCARVWLYLLGVYLAAPLLIGFDDFPLDISFYLLSYYSDVYHFSTFSWEDENQSCPIISIVSDAMNQCMQPEQDKIALHIG